MASYNLRKVLGSRFSSDDDVKLIVMTGGTDEWHLEKDRLVIDEDLLPEGEPSDAISIKYNQIWEAKGADASENAADARKFVIIDFDACMMNSVEMDLVLADYTDYYIASPELEPGYGRIQRMAEPSWICP